MPRKLTDADVVGPAPEPEEPEGGAGGDEGSGGEPSTRTIAFDGKSVEVAAGIAEMWEARERGFQQRLSAQGSELGEVRGRIAALEGRVAPPADASRPASGEMTDEEYYSKIQDLMLEDPIAAEKLREQRIERRYSRDQAHRELRSNWRARLDAFYGDNPDLSKDEDLVDLTYQTLVRTDPEVASLVKQGNLDAVFERVADATRRRILDYAGRRGELRPVSRGGRMAVTEGGGLRTGGRAAPAEDEGPKSVSEVIKSKQARHKGAYSGAAKRDYRPKPGTE